MSEKQQMYKLIKLGGAVMFIPFLMVAGPLGGYWVGSWLRERFPWGGQIFWVCIVLGFVFSLWEVIRIIRFLRDVEGKSDG